MVTPGSDSPKVLHPFGYHSWQSGRMEMETSAPCIYKKYLFGEIFHGKGLDWQEFVKILGLLVINSTKCFIEKNNADNAATTLMAHLAPKIKVLRDGQWQEQNAAII
ncbi:hypothetical protein AAHE18_05G099200 [Arachis hypogaea]|nr:ATPase [Arachis hypogaea]